MNVLVTGAGGFVAPHVANAFRDAGHTVRTTDARPVAADSGSMTADFTDAEQAAELMAGIDVICHLGGVGDVYLALDQPEEAALANVVGTAILLKAAKNSGVSKFIYTSTWEVYGDPEYQPLDEKHRCEPDHPYGITKLAGERIALSYDALKDQPVVALRLGTAYGTGMRPNSVFSIFIDKARRGEPLMVQGSGAQARQFTHVDQHPTTGGDGCRRDTDED
jgi:nucleoside-diphosphate-sugar epimerase